MDSTRFEARLRAEGFPEIRTNGDITLTVDGSRRTYRAGDEFAMQAGCKHVEDVGAQGVKYLVGRRPVQS